MDSGFESRPQVRQGFNELNEAFNRARLWKKKGLLFRHCKSASIDTARMSSAIVQPSGAKMKQLLIWVFVLALTNASGGAENPLSITVLKTERGGSSHIYLLFSVENKSDQRFESTTWSCVFLNRGNPVYEGGSLVENVPPGSHAIKRYLFDYGGPFDKIECRFMGSRPQVPLESLFRQIHLW